MKFHKNKLLTAVQLLRSRLLWVPAVPIAMTIETVSDDTNLR